MSFICHESLPTTEKSLKWIFLFSGVQSFGTIGGRVSIKLNGDPMATYSSPVPLWPQRLYPLLLLLWYLFFRSMSKCAYFVELLTFNEMQMANLLNTIKPPPRSPELNVMLVFDGKCRLVRMACITHDSIYSRHAGASRAQQRLMYNDFYCCWISLDTTATKHRVHMERTGCRKRARNIAPSWIISSESISLNSSMWTFIIFLIDTPERKQ